MTVGSTDVSIRLTTQCTGKRKESERQNPNTFCAKRFHEMRITGSYKPYSLHTMFVPVAISNYPTIVAVSICSTSISLQDRVCGRSEEAHGVLPGPLGWIPG
eukprot:scaffold95788_cov59-Attheya_sp.AAC.2